jgi:hypothetical protein
VALLMTSPAWARAHAQLPPASAAAVALGGRSTAVARGFSAVAGNPAGLAMPRASHVTASFFPLLGGCAIGPVTCGELSEWGGKDTPDAVREGWLQEIERRGRQRGRFHGSVTLAAASVGLFGIQISSHALGAVEVNPDAAELLLFGNAGRSGAPREFHLAGFHIDGFAVTTVAVGAGIPLDIEIGDAPGQSFAVGATLKYTLGNALWGARDLGSFFSDDPLVLWERFPIVQQRGAPLRAGDGVGLDAGFQWDVHPWSFGLAVENLVNTFRWDLDRLVFRPGTALLTQDGAESDFAPRPAAEAPDALLEPVRDFRFGPRLAVGFGRTLGARTSVFSQLDVALGHSSAALPDVELGAAVEHRLVERIPLRFHASVLDGGVRLGGGAGVRLGKVHLSGAGSFRSDDGVEGPEWMLTLSLGGS